MRSILILGANGMLGHALDRYFTSHNYQVRPVTRAQFDIAVDPISKFESLLSGVEVVINAAGVIKPLIAKTPIESVLSVNSMFPRNIAMLTSKKGILSFHVTTDCVYSGKAGKYDETALFDAEDIYGMSKNAGEVEGQMTIRTSIIGEEKGQTRSLLEWAICQKGKTVKGFTNHRWNGVTTLYLAEIIETILNKGYYQKRLFHIHSPDTVTKFELLRIFNETYGLGLTIQPVEAQDVINRDLTSVYDLTGKVSTKSIRNQVEEMRAFFGRKIQ